MLTVTAEVSSYENVDVSFSNPAETYGMRGLSSQLVTVGVSETLTEYSAGRFRFQTDDLSPGELLEYWLKVVDDEFEFFIPSLHCSVASPYPDSLSASDSGSSSEGSGRSVRLKREQTPPERFGQYRGDAVRLRVSARSPVGLPTHIFGQLMRVFDVAEGIEQEDFSFIVSPLDADAYPVDEPSPTQNPPFFRTSAIDVLLPSPRAADQTWEKIVEEVDNLVASYNRRDTLVVAASETIE